jgi:hypothetical protein
MYESLAFSTSLFFHSIFLSGRGILLTDPMWWSHVEERIFCRRRGVEQHQGDAEELGVPRHLPEGGGDHLRGGDVSCHSCPGGHAAEITHVRMNSCT